ncbi:MAG TPA: cell division protein FtsH, partial [Patescibacteria group bacterium]|nr:cell division protein FtsH [Patescibacteria group bacterium]
MPDDNKKGDDKGRKGAEFKVPPRTYLLWIAIIGLIPLLVVFRNNTANQGQQLSQYEFLDKVTNDLIIKAVVTLDPQSPFLR